MRHNSYLLCFNAVASNKRDPPLSLQMPLLLPRAFLNPWTCYTAKYNIALKI